MTGVLVLITGTGRSGTSTVSGALHHLGLFVPGPYLNANASNPKGFYESKWAVQFHKGLLHEAGLDDFDARPSALEIMRPFLTADVKAGLVDWLAKQAAQDSQVVVKDPRSVWLQHLWGEAAAEAGLEIKYLSMLRHPAETIGSRTAYYAKNADALQRRRYQTFSLARWLNSSLINERETRGQPRTFVSYPDLLSDWRPVMRQVRDDLGLSYDSDLEGGEKHAVDDFIDPDLRRVRVTWDDLDVPHTLQTLTESVYQELVGLRGIDDETQVRARLDEVSTSYEQLYAESAAIAHDEYQADLRVARLQSEQKGREEGRADAEKAAKKARRAAQEKAAARPEPPPAADPADRLVRDVTSTELLRLVGGRLRGRMRRR